MKQNSSEKARHLSRRYYALGGVFLVLCIAFVAVLAFYQVRGSTLPYEKEGTVRTYTVPGLRGEIYDCNGTLLVGNSTGYNLIYEYGAMPETRKEVNASLLAVLDALLRTGNGDKLADDLFILEGTYPKMTFSSKIRDKESSEYQAYKKFLERQNLMSEETTAKDVMEYFTARYGLTTTLYTNQEITSLIRLYYEMERVDFGSYVSYTIAEDVNMKLITAIEESNIEGVNFQISAKREYQYPGIASHILGRVGSITAETADYYLELGYSPDDKVGTSGCEATFEEWLRGRDGTLVVRYDEAGNMVEKYYDPEPIRGNDVYLTIDIDLQIAAEEGLAESIESIDSSEAGAITVMDPNSGALLATASYPTYDLTQFDSREYVQSLNNNSSNPWLNRALNGRYAPGSTYKVGAALAALESGTIGETTTYDCEHIYPHYDCPTCLGTHGILNVTDAIRVSCNIFFYYVGDAMGVDAMTGYTSRLGLGVDTGLELSHTTGTIAGESVNGGDIPRSAIGQSTHLYSPLQLSVYMSTIVNGGTRYRAHVLDRICKYYTGELVEETESQVMETVDFSDETYQILMNAMSDVVSSNSSVSRYFADVPVSVGGKTGTAEVTGKTDYALFCGFAPVESPQIVVSCVIEEGKYGYRAAYAAGKVMAKYFEKLAASAESDASPQKTT